ncbi:MAG TPA: N-acetylmuramoyl-L-alanine amidase [Acidimicrobiia bacterium]|nr:N-acetylmuramoyl-L-alanine amidase [Acidimicrobiia bacterium]
MTRRIVTVLGIVLALAVPTACSHGGKATGVNSAGGQPAGGSTTSSSVPVDGSSSSSPGSTAAPASPSSTVATVKGTAAGSGPASTATTRPATPAGSVPDPRDAASGAFIAGDNGAAVASQAGGAITGRIRAGVAMAVDARQGGWAHVVTPCENHLWVKVADGRIAPTADIVIDAGHGGPESGAVGQGGLTEAELNLAVARMTVEALAADGVTAALARTGDYRQTLASRVAVATAMHPKAFLSIHHNAEPDGSRPGPGTETYYQTGKDVPPLRSAASKRLAGLIYEEVVRALSAYSADWVADRDAGAKYRLGDSGNDYYGVLRLSAAGGVVGSLAELAFISNPSEEALLKRDDVRRAEAAAVARGIVRFLRTEDPGSGFVVPYPRTEPAGGGGGTQGCVDPS